MLNAIWQLLSDNGLDTADIAESMRKLFYVENGVPQGKLASLSDFPIIGILLNLLASFAPAVETTTLL